MVSKVPFTIMQTTYDQTLAPINLVTCYNETSKPIKYCMSNSYAFGGNNASLIIGKVYV